MAIWNKVIDEYSGYLINLSDALCGIQENIPNLLNPVNDSEMIIASDYSGQHKGAKFEAYSFLITTKKAVSIWLPLLDEFRENNMPDNRRFSFKNLNENVRRRALPKFLHAVGRLEGNLISILVDCKIDSLFVGGPISLKSAFHDCFTNEMKNGTVEKMFRLANFFALIIAGLREENQVSFWISDHDEALDTNNKREMFSRLASYLTYGLTKWKKPAENIFGTTEAHSLPYWSEDMASIADLVAGAYCNLAEFLPASFGAKHAYRTVNQANIKDKRALEVCEWLATGKNSLKHVLLRLQMNSNNEVIATAQSFVS